ncbi:receptor-type tyrosine-protein phosphatase N2 [Pipistrellus kuhlii]|uniref:Protein tyrosine phosphatase receptor type N2 n=3 Tax=Pipistrellus kuhlii TaxID=59472 RepID=A0A7J7R7B3_PIPKU|nr:receptor-type tyrosine-protein phosphatase N2 [Pipistrellus kuhlii]XP_045434232.1 receptor-type tyrosine-protein phosphatase N2 [Pipistrellus kuhlii]KAF6271984.1 protein tyrosine phosphatase receptor type N2 [Pipistrellus kuhlii]
MGPPLALPLLLLLLPPLPPAAPAPLARPLAGLRGCSLEDGLCRWWETCVLDGAFGRCQKVPVTDVYRYEVSPVAQQRPRAALRRLSRAGFAWQDGDTQRVLAQALAHVPRAQLWRPEAAAQTRSWRLRAEDERRPGVQGDRVLATALEYSLGSREALPPAAARDLLPRTQRGGRVAQGEGPPADSVLTYMPQTSALTFAPAPRTGHPPGRPLQALSRLPPGELSPEGGGGVQQRDLLRQLVAYLAMAPPWPPEAGPLAPDALRVPWGGHGKRLSPPEDATAPLGTGDGTGARQGAAQGHGEAGPASRSPGDEQADGPAAWSSEEAAAGVENVKSRTYSSELPGRPRPEPRARGLGQSPRWVPRASQEQEDPGPGLRLEVKAPEEEEAYGYIVTESDPLSLEKGRQLLADVAGLLQVPTGVLADTEVLGPAVTFRVSANVQNVTPADVAKTAVSNKDKLERSSGLRVLQAGVGSKSKLQPPPRPAEQEDSTKFLVLTLLSIAAILGVLLASGVIYCLRHDSHRRLREKLRGLAGDPGPDATAAYQELCRQRMAVRTSEHAEAPHVSRISSVSSQFSDGPMPSPPARSSTSSWSEEPALPNMDISTGHMVLAYMEDHLRNKNRLEQEWEALCAYQAEPSSTLVAQREENAPKNRCPAVLAYDHSRVLLKPENSHSNSDYINASPIMDHDPRSPAYIATQGPLPATVADFWQMVWESGCAVLVMLAPLAENGVRQCYHYWPAEGSNLYHIYEVNLVSEHIWCEDFLVRSFYLKNLQTNETRTVTQFHFLGWYDQGVPASTRSLLDFRRKVNKCYKGRSCPIIVHCSDGAGRSGTYILIDMVLNKMAKGAKEMDMAATLEHLRDQRPGMVQTKAQFEFALTAVAEEVNAILKALPQ